MESIVLSPEFLITSLVVVLMPGTGVIYTISAGLFMGFRASIAAACGCTLGIVPHLLASILGLSALLHMSALAFQVLKYAGTAYLLYLAWSMWRVTGALKFDQQNQKNSMLQIAMKGFLINILNPKLSIFFLAFLPLFISADASSPVLHLLFLSAVFMTMTLCVFILYGVSAHSVRTHVVTSPKSILWLQRTFAAIFATLGAKLAMSDQ